MGNYPRITSTDVQSAYVAAQNAVAQSAEDTEDALNEFMPDGASVGDLVRVAGLDPLRLQPLDPATYSTAVQLGEHTDEGDVHGRRLAADSRGIDSPPGDFPVGHSVMNMSAGRGQPTDRAGQLHTDRAGARASQRFVVSGNVVSSPREFTRLWLGESLKWQGYWSETQPDLGLIPANDLRSLNADGDPSPIDAIGETLYGAITDDLWRYNFANDTWTQIYDFDSIAGIQSGPVAIRRTGDGRAIISRNSAGLWKSDDLVGDLDGDTTWTQVLETTEGGGQKGQIFHRCLSVWRNYVFATEYVTEGATRVASRKAWLSTDNGDTFSVVFDLHDETWLEDPEKTHLHCAEIDPWEPGETPRLWLAFHGDGTDQRIIYSQNLGSTWQIFLDGNSIGNQALAKPTTITATMRAVLFGSDGKPDGVQRWVRGGPVGVFPITLAWEYVSTTPGLKLVARQQHRDPTTGMAFIVFAARWPGHPSFIVGTLDGMRMETVFRADPAAISDHPRTTMAALVGRQFVVSVTDTALDQKRLHVGRPPRQGSPTTVQTQARFDARYQQRTPDGVRNGNAIGPAPGIYEDRVMDTDRLYAVPLYLPTAAKAGVIACRVTTAGTGVIRLGVYESTRTGTGEPGDLIIDAGTVDVDTDGHKPISWVPDVELFGPRWVWLAAVAQGGTPPEVVCLACRPSGMTGSSHGAMTLGNDRAYTMDGVDGDLPDTFEEGPTARQTAPLVVLRL